MTEYRKTHSRNGFDHEQAFHEQLRKEGAVPSEGTDVVPAAHVRRYASTDGNRADSGAFAKGGVKIWSQAPHKGPGPDPRGFKHHDGDGVPIITSRAEVDEVIARTANTDSPLLWERD